MTKNELIDGLFDWVDEDEDNLSVIIVAGDEGGVHVAYNGTNENLVYSLSEAMRNNAYLREAWVKAFGLTRSYKTSKTTGNDYYDKAETNND